MRRHLTRLLILALVPVLWLGYHAPAAQAATAGSAQGGFNTGETTGMNAPLGDDVICSVKGAWKVDAVSYAIVGNVACSTGWAVSSALVTLSTGSIGCPMGGGSVGQVDGVASAGFSLGSTSALPEHADTACNVTELCFSVAKRVHSMGSWEADKVHSGCFDFALGPPPVPEAPAHQGECAYGTPTASTYYYRTVQHPTNIDYFTEQVHLAWSPWKGVPAGGASTGGIVVHFGTGSETYSSSYSATATWSSSALRSKSAPAGVFGRESRHLGAQVHITQANGKYGSSVQQGYKTTYGVTDPAKCLFWIGPKVWDDGKPGGPDEPWADPLPPEPLPDLTPEPVAGDPCEFTLTDPTTWASAGICRLVALVERLIGVVGQVVKALGTLAGAIVDGIGSLLRALFVPDMSKWDIGGLRDQALARPPFSLVASLAGGVQGLVDGYQGAGGCGTIANFDAPGVSVDDAASIGCSEMRSTPGFGALYGLVKAGLIAGTALLLFRMFAGYFQETT